MTRALIRTLGATGDEATRGLSYGAQYITDQTQSTGIGDNSVTNVGSETLTLPAGTYLVTFGANFRIESTNYTTGFPTGHLYVTDTDNNYLSVNDDYHSSCPMPRWQADGATDQYLGCYSKVTTITLATETIVKLRGKINKLGQAGSVAAILRAYMIWERVV